METKWTLQPFVLHNRYTDFLGSWKFLLSKARFSQVKQVLLHRLQHVHHPHCFLIVIMVLVINRNTNNNSESNGNNKKLEFAPGGLGDDRIWR